ncbi:MAG: tRNA pseudouridine(55) synthase TruB [Holosporales bacterium]|jgi:tRNA pseudouridine55 synthase|nr:tRNA pseudouridine(55) synthase TruB [Holosporales bacterium]
MCSDTELSGFLVIDKLEGKTSAFIDFLCKKKLGVKKVGHLGTLDPFATGVLVIAINKATRAIRYIKPISKVYEFVVKFGEQTTTGDKTGEVVKTDSSYPDMNALENVLTNFTGEINQVPHAFSAIKVNGKRAYQLARKGIVPEIAPRKTTVFDIKILKQLDCRMFSLTATVSPGTYIRSLCEDIAKALDTVGHAWALRRIADGQFSIDQAISIDCINECDIIPIDRVVTCEQS